MAENTVKTVPEVEAFANALYALCKQHKVTIGGCGCCNSPYGSLEGSDGKKHYIANLLVTNDGVTYDPDDF